MKWLESHWYSSSASPLLVPFSWLFHLMTTLRRLAYTLGLLRSYRVAVPVIVIGNISVGGTGKTPLVLWLVRQLREAGYRPGIVSRGYGGQAQRWPQQVRPDSDPVVVGDETVLLAQRCDCPVVAAPDRVTAARQLLKHKPCDVIISDDGLQHYRLKRDVEIAVIDGERRFGNGHLLPAGPLREPRSRLARVNFVIANGLAGRGEFAMTLLANDIRSVTDKQLSLPFEQFNGQTVHAVAGIGNPQRFFNLLRSRGMDVIEHPFADHYPFQAQDLDFGDELPVLMTEKDAVKCRSYGNSRMWYVPIEAQLPEPLVLRLLQMVKKLTELKQ
jgi:tetraacyldisaccharide 4'-kinase